jgi:glucuronate isomerase
MSLLHGDRFFPADPTTRTITRRLYESVRTVPIVSLHGHTQASWFADDEAFSDPAKLFIQPDHYVHRMLYSQGISLDDLEIRAETILFPRKVWRIFADNYYLFRGTPMRMWLDFAFQELFGLQEILSGATADLYFDTISAELQKPAFRPRALFQRFNLEVLATTDSALDGLEHHAAIRDSGWGGRVIPTFRPDAVVNPEFERFGLNIRRLGEQTGEDTAAWPGYLAALRGARERFRKMGCTATDHGHPTARTANLSTNESEALFARVLTALATKEEQELFRAQMLTEMARMSLEDGLVMQIHPGSMRNHNSMLYAKFGRDMGADIPRATNYVDDLKPLLDRFGNERNLSIILFTLDESTYSRELAPLAGHDPCLWLGPPWWFHDSPEGMMRFREMTTETAGFYNTVGFNDDTRAFLSIPARHDVARRVDCAFLARLVVEHRLTEEEAFGTARDLTTNLVRRAYKLSS